MKVVINCDYGGFSISLECAELMESMGDETVLGELTEYRKQVRWAEYYKEHGKFPKDFPVKNTYLRDDIKAGRSPHWYGYDLREGDQRANPHLVAAVSILGSARASGELAKLKIVEIPDGTDWEIEEYDGREWVAERHRTWN